MARTLILTLGLSVASLAGSAVTMLHLTVGVVHTFNPEHGDIPWAVTYEGQYYPVRDAARAILPRLGWEDPALRQELALAWVYKVELAGTRPVDPAAWEPIPEQYHPPQVERRDDGSVEVILWTTSPVGQNGFDRRLYRFDDDGSLTCEVLQTESEPRATWFWSGSAKPLTTRRPR